MDNAVDNTGTPMFIHEGCEHCLFLGHVLGHDMYHCKNGVHKNGTIMLRYSSEGNDYHSGLHFSTGEYFNEFINSPDMESLQRQLLLGREALLRACARGRVPIEVAL